MTEQSIDPKEVGQFVDAFMDSEGCCHDLLYTSAFLKGQGLSDDDISAWAAKNNVTCDCDAISKFGKPT